MMAMLDDDPWVDPPDPEEIDAVIASYKTAIGDQRQAAADRMTATARRFGLIARFDVFGPHMVEPVMRNGSIADADGEHCSVRIVTGPDAGKGYRIPIAGGPVWMGGLGPEDLLSARRAPHITDAAAR